MMDFLNGQLLQGERMFSPFPGAVDRSTNSTGKSGRKGKEGFRYFGSASLRHILHTVQYTIPTTLAITHTYIPTTRDAAKANAIVPDTDATEADADSHI